MCVIFWPMRASTTRFDGAFVVYMLSHNRPMWEVLAPHRKDITEEFMRGFDGMTAEPVSIEELVAAREALIARYRG